jgi:hypothetical protein
MWLPEDEHVDVRIGRRAAPVPPGGRARLVHDRKPDAVELDASDLRKPGAQRRTVVVAVDGHQPGGPLFQRVEQLHAHPVAGVDDHVGGVDGVPQRRGQVPGPRRQVRVGGEQELHGFMLHCCARARL